MAEQTTNLGLTKPDAAEGYDINVFNNNAELIDNAVGALQNELGGAGGGLGDKVDTIKEDTSGIIETLGWMKTATDRIGSSIDTTESSTLWGMLLKLQKSVDAANANIATLLTQTKGVKAIVSGQVTAPSDGNVSFTIPNTMNADKVVIIANYLATPNSTMHGVSWVRNGYTVNARGQSGTTITYQFIEFF